MLEVSFNNYCLIVLIWSMLQSVAGPFFMPGVRGEAGPNTSLSVVSGVRLAPTLLYPWCPG